MTARIKFESLERTHDIIFSIFRLITESYLHFEFIFMNVADIENHYHHFLDLSTTEFLQFANIHFPKTLLDAKTTKTHSQT